MVAALPRALRARQAIFEETGGLHAAGLFTLDGECRRSAEDVGRHNAVDKVVGAMIFEDSTPLPDHVLAVSGQYIIADRSKGLVCRRADRVRGIGAIEPGNRAG